ncbi:hypothetical protein PRZ48_003503 [Zasmidium cellare]|uniref:Uncharacterized protein n=1 Tax=Zasmidium cellare TaxID=395010 RepID=A0ABR0EW98_ZASCE|nr:hypothetical protein PRZ48_003503 [Zasmidium cellare]
MAVALRLHGANSATPDELELFTPDSLMPGAELMDSLYSTYKSPPPYMGQTFVQYCYLLQINRGIMVAYLDEESSPAKSVPLAFAEDMYRRLLEWAGQLPESLAARDDMPHHAAVLHASFHSMVMELFRPFLFQRTKLARIPRPDTRPGDLFLSSSNRMVEIFRLYYTRYRDSSPIHTITWLIAPIYTAHIALRGTADTLQQRRLDFKMCIDALMALGVVLPMKEAIVRGTMGMAVLSGLMTLQESRLMLKEALKGERQAEMVGTTLTIDFQLAMEDPNGSSVDVFAKQYLAMGSSEA